MSRFSEARRRAVTALTAGLALAALALAAPPAAAAPLDAPRDKGIVGEGVDGYAKIRDESRADAEIRALVAEINRKREDLYSRRAEEEGVAVEAIAKIYAKKIYEKAPAGWWFRTEDGRWVQK